MPSRNIVKTYVPNSYYHIYNRGVEKRRIFLDDIDYSVFLNLLRRYLTQQTVTDRYGRRYENFSKKLELLAYCLMPNHFHLFIYQQSDRYAISKFLQRVMTAYTMYFNKRHKRVGRLFQDRFKASTITNERYLLHISRYIHLNPANSNSQSGFDEYPYSSYQYYTNQKKSDWVHPDRILAMFAEQKQPYSEFVKDFKDYKSSLEELKVELAL